MSLFQKLLGSTALSVAASAAPAPDPATETPPPAPAPTPSASNAQPLSEERIETALQAARSEGRAEGLAEGSKAERDRTASVFASEEGQANMGMAAWMLGANPTATADAIVAQLKTMPAAAAAAPAAPAAHVTTPLANTPKIDLTGGQPAAAATEGGGDAAATNDKLWDAVQAEASANFYGSATAPTQMAAGGAAAPTPKAGY